jgi:hypothetical protein
MDTRRVGPFQSRARQLAVGRFLLLLAVPFCLAAQDRPDMRAILDRLNRLEEQNCRLTEEIRALKEQLAKAGAAASEPAAAPVEERVAVAERRIEELDQTKAGSEQRLPVTLTGTVLFNAFRNGGFSGTSINPTTAALTRGGAAGGGTFRQTIFGMRFDGPEIGRGAKVTGALYLDLFAGTGTSLNQLARLRVARLNIEWKNTTVTFSHDKPIMAPREADSLAQVGVTPLTGAGNLWLWQPQFRVEHRMAFGAHAGLDAQGGVYQTSESGTGVSAEYASSLASARPGLEGRFLFWGDRGGRRVEIAPSFHVSQSHVAGESVPSRIASVDWLLRPLPKVDFTGQFFQGENVGIIGGLRQGISFLSEHRPTAVHTQGAWAQLAFRATPRLTFHWYGGGEDDRNADLLSGSVARNLAYAANLMYRLGPNILASFEASQVRTTYLNVGTRLNNHYDLALAYLF